MSAFEQTPGASCGHCLLQRVFMSPQTPNISPYSTYEMALLNILCILVDAQFISAGANTGCGGVVNALARCAKAFHHVDHTHCIQYAIL